MWGGVSGGLFFGILIIFEGGGMDQGGRRWEKVESCRTAAAGAGISTSRWRGPSEHAERKVSAGSTSPTLVIHNLGALRNEQCI